MEIKIDDYLNPEDLKTICKEVFYNKVREEMRNFNVADIIATISYAEVAAMVDWNHFVDYLWSLRK